MKYLNTYMNKEIREKIFENKFYVYELIDPRDNKVFYVGKGQKYRCFVHEYKAKNNKISNNNKHLFNKIRNIILNDCIIYNIIFSSMCENLCYDYEENLIKMYGIENLCNIELSNKGVKHTIETREKMKNSQIGKKHSEETKEKLSLINTGKKHSDETKNKVSNSLREQYSNGTRKPKTFTHNDKWRESIEKLKGRKHDAESIQKMKDTHKGKIISNEQREKISRTLTMERIIITINCEICSTEFNLTIIKDGVNKIKKCCSRSCSSILSNKNRKIIELDEDIEI